MKNQPLKAKMLSGSFFSAKNSEIVKYLYALEQYLD